MAKMDVSDISGPRRKATSPVASMATASPIPDAEAGVPGFKSVVKRRVFERYVKRLIGEVGYFSAEHEVIRSTADVLFDVTELQRVVIGLVDKKAGKLRGYYAIGCEASPQLEKFSVDLKTPSFFNQLLRKPQAVWVSPEREAEVAGLVPGEFKQAAQSDEYIVMPVFNSKGAFGIVYADKAINAGGDLSEAELKICRTIANATSKHLIQMAKKTKTGKEG